jgi:hypothetical protein
MKTNQERLEAKIQVNNRKLEFLRKNVYHSKRDENQSRENEIRVGSLPKI